MLPWMVRAVHSIIPGLSERPQGAASPLADDVRSEAGKGASLPLAGVWTGYIRDRCAETSVTV